MKELLRRFFQKPVLAAEILAATFFITLLTLAMPIYVIQILNRYVSYGFHGTLFTLTSGMLIAIVLQFAFRVLRTKMAAAVNQEPNDKLAFEILSVITRAKAEPLEQFSKTRVQETLNNVQTIQNAYDAQSLNSIMDAPFSLLLIGAAYLLSPILAVITVFGIFLGLALGWIGIRKSQKTSERYFREITSHRSLNQSTVNAVDTVRAFNASGFLQKIWTSQLAQISRLRNMIMDTKELSQTFTLTGNSLMSVFLYAAGATLVVRGELTVGALIGANILAGKAYQNTTRLVQTAYLFGRAKEAFSEISQLKRLPAEPGDGSALRKYQGRLELKDVGFAYPHSRHPLFESASLVVEPGKALAVYGRNGTGKTTLARMLVGLLEPRRGSILADNVNIQQLAAPWWRNQIVYMPQEPTFINATIKENLLLLNPDLDDSRLNNILRMTDLKSFLDQTPDGLDTRMTDNGKNLPLGIRRRLSLARGLVADGRLVVLDEPTDALDEQGVLAVYNIMNHLIKARKTIIVFSNDPKILKGAAMVLNLNIKPVPELKMVPVQTGRGE